MKIEEEVHYMPTIDDVARLSGVSMMTVSRVMNGSGVVADATREKVILAAEQLGYQPNLLARSLKTSRTNTIGIMLTHIENPIYNLFTSAIVSEAEKIDYDVILSSANDMESALHALRTLMAKRIDGLIVLPVEFGGPIKTLQDVMINKRLVESFYEKLEVVVEGFGQKDFPLVVLGKNDVLPNCSHVDIDYRASGRIAVDYLYQQNHRDIGYIRHSVGNISLWGQRHQGFIDGMLEYGLDIVESWSVDSLDTAESGYQAFLRMMESNKTMPTAVACANDYMAAGAVQAAISKGLRVPEDISILGNDGSLVCNVVVPRLSTVSIQPYLAGTACMRLLWDGIKDTGAGEKVVVTPKITEGESVMRRL